VDDQFALNPDDWVKVVTEMEPNLRWEDVVSSLHDEISRPTSCRFLARVLSGAPSAFGGLWRPWSNRRAQLANLEGLVFLPKDVLYLPDPSHPVVSLENVSTASSSVKSHASGVQGSIWNSLDLVQTLIDFVAPANPDDRTMARITALFERATSACPDLVFIALSMLEVRDTTPFLQDAS
jgi:hypothetical protein